MKIIVDNLIFEALKPSEFREYMEVGRDLAMKRIGQIWSKLQAESIGSNRNGDRLYFNITEKVDFWGLEEIPTSIVIDKFFKENGFEIVDVKNNKAKNLKDGRIVSIMKVLESLRKVNPEFVAKYIKEYDRERSLMLDKQDKIMVISKSAYDLAGMSTYRGWGSCMDIRKGVNKKYVPLEIETGTLVSYLVNPSDRNINNPYARVLIKPYLNIIDETNILYGVEHDIVKYGKRDAEYIKTLINLLDKAQEDKTGIFIINTKSFPDFDGEKTIVKTTDVNFYKKLVSVEDIERFFSLIGIKNYKINDNSTVDVDDNVDISRLKLKIIPINFNNVSGFFNCMGNNLQSLEGAPKKVGGAFTCSDNELKSLEGAPLKVGSSFYCDNNELKTLDGAPLEVGGSFICSNNQLQSLKGITKYIQDGVNCSDNELISLEGIQEYIGNSFICSENNLETLEGAPTEVRRNFDCSNNKLKSLEGAPKKVGGSFLCNDNIKKFTEEDVKNISDVTGEVEV